MCWSGLAQTDATGTIKCATTQHAKDISSFYNGRTKTAAKLTRTKFQSWPLVGHLAIVILAHDLNLVFDHMVCAHAAAGGHLQTLQWLRAKGCNWSSSTFWSAVGNDHFLVARWSFENGCAWDDGYSQPAQSLHMLKWLCASNIPIPYGTCSHFAACHDEINVCLKFNSDFYLYFIFSFSRAQPLYPPVTYVTRCLWHLLWRKCFRVRARVLACVCVRACVCAGVQSVGTSHVLFIPITAIEGDAVQGCSVSYHCQRSWLAQNKDQNFHGLWKERRFLPDASVQLSTVLNMSRCRWGRNTVCLHFQELSELRNLIFRLLHFQQQARPPHSTVIIQSCAFA